MNCSMLAKHMSLESNFASRLSLSRQLEGNARLSSLRGVTNTESLTTKQTHSLTKSLFGDPCGKRTSGSQMLPIARFPLHHGLTA